MKLGLLTAAFPDLSLEQVAAWAAGEGFETLEIACWPAARRRAAPLRRASRTSTSTRFDPDEVHATIEPARARRSRRSPTTRTTSTPTTRTARRSTATCAR